MVHPSSVVGAWRAGFAACRVSPQNLTIGRFKNDKFIDAPGDAILSCFVDWCGFLLKRREDMRQRVRFSVFLVTGMVMQFAPGNGGDAGSMCQE